MRAPREDCSVLLDQLARGTADTQAGSARERSLFARAEGLRTAGLAALFVLAVAYETTSSFVLAAAAAIAAAGALHWFIARAARS
ncbi:MAG: hypothetical protein HY812_13105 [Planctomycetes bacterium]|nr:hypothetical protein [Planctomycetota bacterium]